MADPCACRVPLKGRRLLRLAARVGCASARERVPLAVEGNDLEAGRARRGELRVGNGQQIAMASDSCRCLERVVRIDLLDRRRGAVLAELQLGDLVAEVLHGPEAARLEKDPIHVGQIGPWNRGASSGYWI